MIHGIAGPSAPYHMNGYQSFRHYENKASVERLRCVRLLWAATGSSGEYGPKWRVMVIWEELPVVLQITFLVLFCNVWLGCFHNKMSICFWNGFEISLRFHDVLVNEGWHCAPTTCNPLHCIDVFWWCGRLFVGMKNEVFRSCVSHWRKY